MGNQATAIGVIVPSTNLSPNQSRMEIALVNADGTAAGTVKKQAAQTDSVAASLPAMVTDFNALLAKLRLAGVIS